MAAVVLFGIGLVLIFDNKDWGRERVSRKINPSLTITSKDLSQISQA